MVKIKKAKPKKPENADKKESKTSQREIEIKELTERIAKTKYNKKTQHAIGLYKARLAALKNKEETRRSSGVGRSEHGWSVRKSGDATVVLLGFPSVGKSSLLNVITNANSKIGHFAFTTLTCIPGDLEYKGAKIQILDVPGVVKGAAAGTGKGKEVLQVIRNADLILMLIDVFYPEHLKILEQEIFDTHVRINQKKPDIKIKKTSRGGIHIGRTVPSSALTDETIRGILKEFKLANAEVLIRTKIDADQLIDVIEGNRVYLNAIKVLNKIDLVSRGELELVKKLIDPDICVSAAKKINIEELKKSIFDILEFMPVFCKEAGKKADLKEPLILRKGNSIKDMCDRLHKDFTKKFKFARVWGKSAKFPAQKLHLKHKLREGDVVEIHLS